MSDGASDTMKEAGRERLGAADSLTAAVRGMVAGWLWRAGDFVAPRSVPDDCEKVLVERMSVVGGNTDIALSHSVVKTIAGHLATWFDAASLGGPGNYVETMMRAPDGRMFEMTIRPLKRPTPHELRMRAEERLAEALAALAAHPEQSRTDHVPEETGD